MDGISPFPQVQQQLQCSCAITKALHASKLDNYYLSISLIVQRRAVFLHLLFVALINQSFVSILLIWNSCMMRHPAVHTSISRKSSKKKKTPTWNKLAPLYECGLCSYSLAGSLEWSWNGWQFNYPLMSVAVWILPSRSWMCPSRRMRILCSDHLS